MRFSVFFSLALLVASLNPTGSAATPSFSGSASGCGVNIGSVAPSGSPVAFEGSRDAPTQFPEPNVGSCTGYGAVRADAQSIGVSARISSDRNTRTSNAAARSVVDDFVIEAAQGAPATVDATFRFLLHASYVPSALNLNGSNYLAQAAAEIRASASVVQTSTTVTTPFSFREEVFDEASINTVPTFSTFEIVTGPVSLNAGQRFTMVLSLQAEALVTMGQLGFALASVPSGTLGGAVDISALNSFGLADTGSFVTFSQPGYTLQSASAGIVDSQWVVPEPGLASLLVVAALVFVRSRSRHH